MYISIFALNSLFRKLQICKIWIFNIFQNTVVGFILCLMRNMMLYYK